MVSIVILACNQLMYTQACIESIQQHTAEPYELILVDNGSTDGTLAYFQSIPGAKVIHNDQNLGFAKGCNQGMDVSEGEYILLLNNDVIVSQGWLAGLLRCAESSPAVGIVGPRSNNISGTQQDEANYRTVREFHLFAKRYAEQHAGETWGLDRLVGFCMLIKRQVVDQIGGMDEQFGLGNFEDDDYCRRARQAGWTCMVTNEVFIHHFGSRTFTANQIDFHKLLTTNMKLYEAKWGAQGPSVVDLSLD